MDQHISKDAALAMISAFIDEQLASDKGGERIIAVNVFKRRITSVKAAACPPRLKPLPLPVTGEQTPLCGETT